MENSIETNNTYTAPYIDIKLNTEVQEDLSLADYYPDVNRVLFVTARAIPEGKFISGNEIDCDGIISFNVTYLGGDGTIASIPVTTQYTQSSSFSDPVGTPGEFLCRSYAQSPSCRVTSPRTISLKAHLLTRIFCAQVIEYDLDVTDENLSNAAPDVAVTVEKDSIDRSTARLYYGAYSDSVEGEIDLQKCEKIISADAVIDVIDTRVEDSKVSVKADAILAIFYLTSDGIYLNKTTKAPFEAVVPIENISTGDNACADAVVASVEVSMTDTAVTYSIDYDLDVQAVSKDTVTLCRDAFSIEYESTPEMNEISILEPQRFTNAHLTQTGELKRHGEAKAGEYVLNTTASAQSENVDIADGKLKISGTIYVQSAIRQDGDVVTEDGKIPFAYSCDIMNTDAKPLVLSNIEVTDVSSRIDSSTLLITAELGLSISALAEVTQTAVSKLIIRTNEKKSEDYSIKICFPSEKEDIWSICKRYGCSRRTIEKINGWQEGQTTIGNGPIIIE